jgi:hypothetical protein
MNSPEPVDEASIEILPKGLPLWGNILIVVIYLSVVIFFSYRIIDRKRLS